MHSPSQWIDIHDLTEQGQELFVKDISIGL